MDFGTKIRLLREKLTISQLELSLLLMVSVVTVNRWENSKFFPTLKSKRKLKILFQKHGL
jgi:DNA-binding transcriptional regulator YiaG